MNIRFFLNRIRRKLRSRIKVREVVRRVYWLEFENESILNFLAKYKVFEHNHEASYGRHSTAKIQNYVGFRSGFVINVIETSNS